MSLFFLPAYLLLITITKHLLGNARLSRLWDDQPQDQKAVYPINPIGDSVDVGTPTFSNASATCERRLFQKAYSAFLQFRQVASLPLHNLIALVNNALQV